MRPVGRQLNEVVLDNDSAGVTFTGAWSNSTQARVTTTKTTAPSPTRFAIASPARRPAPKQRSPPTRRTSPQAGFYPVYTWVLGGAESHDAALPDQPHRRADADSRRPQHGRQRLGLPRHVPLRRRQFGAAGSVQISNEGDGRQGRHRRRDSLRQRHGRPEGRTGGVGTSGRFPAIRARTRTRCTGSVASVGQGVDARRRSSGRATSRRRRTWREHMNADTNPFGTSRLHRLPFERTTATRHGDRSRRRRADRFRRRDAQPERRSRLYTRPADQSGHAGAQRHVRAQLEHSRRLTLSSGGFGEIDAAMSQRRARWTPRSSRSASTTTLQDAAADARSEGPRPNRPLDLRSDARVLRRLGGGLRTRCRRLGADQRRAPSATPAAK